MTKVRVLLADDHEPTLEWVRIAIDSDFDVVGAVRNGLDAVSEVRRLDPDVLVIDISMPILDGFQAVARLENGGRPAVVFLTLHSEREFVEAAFNVGALSYVIKSDLNTDLVPAIRAALEGRRHISRSIQGT